MRAGRPKPGPGRAFAFGDVVLLSIPFVARPEYGRAMRAAIGAKVILETANPYPERDGSLAKEVRPETWTCFAKDRAAE
ncbi:hypothetical protein ACXIUS_28375 [Bosea thiooxidans]